jgi:integrase
MAKAKYKRQKNGYFQAKVWDGTYTEKGVKHLVNLRTDKSSRELENMVNEFNLKVKNRQYVRDTDTLFIDYAREWFNLYKADTQLNTRNMYDNIIEKHLVDIQCRVGELNRAHYASLINGIDGARTKQQAAMTIKQIAKSAVHDRLLSPAAFDDIFEDAQKIKYKPTEKRPLTDYEKLAITKADFLPMERAFVYILYGCGLRRGEAIALTRFDISLERRELSVTKAIAFDVNTPTLKDTKNYKHRTVPIPDSVYQVIADYVKSMHTTNLFHMKDGSYITKSSLDKMWARIVRKMQAVSDHEIEGLTPHIFRHNYCSSLCYQIPSVSIDKIAKLLGDTPKMVIEVYNHEILEKEKPTESVSAALAL